MTNDKPTFTVFQRKGSVGWIVKYKDAAGEWRMHRCPPDANVRTKLQAERYAAAWLDEHTECSPIPATRTIRISASKGFTLNLTIVVR